MLRDGLRRVQGAAQVTFLHSTQTPRYQPLAKTVNGRSRVADKAARMAADAKAERECYRAVDARDGLRCRITGVRLSLSGAMTNRVHHHHMVKRSQKSGHDSRDVVTVSPHVHALIHVAGTLRLSGDADKRDERGHLCGVVFEWLGDGKRLFCGVC